MDGPPFQRFKTVFYNTVLIIGQMGNAVNIIFKAIETAFSFTGSVASLG